MARRSKRIQTLRCPVSTVENDQRDSESPKAAGGHSLVWPIRVCAAEQDMVFRVLSLKKSIRFDLKRLKHGVFYMCNSYDVSLENYSILHAK